MKIYAARGQSKSLQAQVAACAYAKDADISLRLWMMYRPRLAREGVSSVYERLERPLIPILAEMKTGIALDDNICGYQNDFAPVLLTGSDYPCTGRQQF